MFSADPKILSRIAPCVRRVLIVDPGTASAKLLADIMKGLGAREVMFAVDETGGVEGARDFEPTLIFTERKGERLDGESLTSRIRRSTLACRRAPVVMVTGEATAAAILGARDSGVHEFLRKPFTSADLLRRVEAVALRPRDWIEAVGYVGPDRRRFNSGDYAGPRKRTVDKPKSGSEVHAATKDQAMRILASAHEQFDRDPMQATRAMREQASALRAVAVKLSDASLAIAAAGLETALSDPRPTKESLAKATATALALTTPETLARAG